MVAVVKTAVPLLGFLLVGSNFPRLAVGICEGDDWNVIPPASDAIVLNLDDDGNKLELPYKMDNVDYRIDLYDKCDISAGDRVALPDTLISVASTPTAPTADGQCKDVKVDLTLKVAELDGSGIYSDTSATEGEIKFCVEVVLKLPDSSNVVPQIDGVAQTGATDVTFNQMVVTLNVDFSTSFTITAIDLVYDDEAEAATTETVDYAVTSCQCDENSVCNDPAARVPIKQSDKIYLCFGVEATDIIIAKVASLDLIQGAPDTNGIRLPAVIAPDTFNALTTVSNEGTQNVVVRTQFVSVFFQDITQPGSAVGTLTLAFKAAARRGRRLMTVDIPPRVLQEGSSTVDVSISGVVFEDENAELNDSSATSNSNLMLATSVMLFFYVFV